MEKVQFVRTTDTLRIHFTTLGRVYQVVDQDDECYKLIDNRGKENWVPFRYLEPATQEDFDQQEPLEPSTILTNH